MLTHIGPVACLDPDDGDDDLRGDAVVGLGTREQFGVVAPKGHAAGDPLGRDEQRPIVAPGLGLVGPIHGIDDGLTETGIRQHALQLRQIEPMPLDHLACEHLGLGRIAGRLGVQLRHGERHTPCEEKFTSDGHGRHLVDW